MEKPARPGVILSAVLIAGLCALAWSNSLEVPFVLDDTRAILSNPALETLWPPWKPFATSIRTGEPLSCRPLTQFTLAVNHWFSGSRVTGYHLVNLVIHILSGLALFGLLFRTLAQGRINSIERTRALPLALIISLAWALHPLQTESVTYVIQRSESLAGLFTLLALYCAVRGWEGKERRKFHLLAILCFAAGIGAKETIIVLPILVFLYDYVFVSPNARSALSGSRVLYGGLAACLIPLAMVLLAGGLGTSRTGLVVAAPWDYLLIQTQVVWRYISLIFWPESLIFDHGPWPVPGLGAVVLPGLGLAFLAGISFWGVWRKKPAAYAGAWFFLLLAPTSSIMPLADPYFEHRMYLALAGPLALLVAGVHALLGRIPETKARKGALIAALLIAVLALAALGARTYYRNRDYKTALSLWSDTVAKNPENPRALHNLGGALVVSGEMEKALPYFLNALALDPDMAASHINAGGILINQKEFGKAEKHLGKAVSLTPDDAVAWLNLGAALYGLQRYGEAKACFQRTLVLDPDNRAARANLDLMP